MKKQFIKNPVIFLLSLSLAFLAGCSQNGGGNSDVDNTKVIRVLSFTDEVPGIIDAYFKTHPNTGYRVESSIVETTNGEYQPVLDNFLINGGKDAPDIFTTEAAFVLKYTRDDLADRTMSFEELGFDDLESRIAQAEIAKYTVQLGSDKYGNVKGLSYQSTGGCFIYRRSLAKEVFGTDDPSLVCEEIGGGTDNLDKFWEAAEKCAEKGVAIVSGDGDLWHVVENSADKGWIDENGKLYIDQNREAFLDYSKKLSDEHYSNKTIDWTDKWFDDMKGAGEKPVLGFFGPAWLINYTIAENCGNTSGDWAVCTSPIGFFYGGTWVSVSKNTNMSSEKKAIVKDIINWITLDPSVDGLQYKWANGTFGGSIGKKDSVASGWVMAHSNGELDFLGGQNMFDYFVPANEYAKGNIYTQKDEAINVIWREEVRDYASGEKSREDAIKNFKERVQTEIGIPYE